MGILGPTSSSGSSYPSLLQYDFGACTGWHTLSTEAASGLSLSALISEGWWWYLVLVLSKCKISVRNFINIYIVAKINSVSFVLTLGEITTRLFCLLAFKLHSQLGQKRSDKTKSSLGAPLILPKKAPTNLFCLLWKAKNSFVCFLGESMAR